MLFSQSQVISGDGVPIGCSPKVDVHVHPHKQWKANIIVDMRAAVSQKQGRPTCQSNSLRLKGGDGAELLP